MSKYNEIKAALLGAGTVGGGVYKLIEKRKSEMPSKIQVFQREVDDAVERALYAQRVSDAIDRGRADIAAGRYVEGIEAAKAAVADKRASRGAA